MDRRNFLATGAAASAVTLLGNKAKADDFSPRPSAWRTFEVVTRIDIPSPQSGLKAWVPLPSIVAADWIRPSESTWTGNATAFTTQKLGRFGGAALKVAWADDAQTPWAQVISRIATRDRAIDLAKPAAPQALSAQDRKLFTSATALLPTDGIVHETATRIAAGHMTDVDKAKALYEWIVANTFRDAAVRGCGMGDIKSMLTTGFLGGKCADLNALFVGMARSLGIPARDLYGIRTAPSRFGYKALGANSATITKSQHCRAEVFLEHFGWVPVDPADVRKVALEEPPGNLPLADPKVAAARNTLFGAWEGNWIAYNAAHDVVLPGSSQPAVPFLMYPQAESVQGRFDCLDADAFKYTITVREV
jgi:transglutaminase-like putative cysteine protease